ncbi:hypothetical protein C8R44DRAFT_862592 [Mycena epipterygia]|nr:hypothetical protein C8R44DRAFT_862592 [Mycena epipterygia]
MSPGKLLCNKCGLCDRTHSSPCLVQFPHKRGPLGSTTLCSRSTTQQVQSCILSLPTSPSFFMLLCPLSSHSLSTPFSIFFTSYLSRDNPPNPLRRSSHHRLRAAAADAPGLTPPTSRVVPRARIERRRRTSISAISAASSPSPLSFSPRRSPAESHANTPSSQSSYTSQLPHYPPALQPAPGALLIFLALTCPIPPVLPISAPPATELVHCTAGRNHTPNGQNFQRQWGANTTGQNGRASHPGTPLPSPNPNSPAHGHPNGNGNRTPWLPGLDSWLPARQKRVKTSPSPAME